MPLTDLGVSFNPAQPRGAGGPKAPVQETVQTLSMRLPKIFGARPPSPAALLTGAGGMGQWGQGGNLIAQVIAALAGIPVQSMASDPNRNGYTGLATGSGGGGSNYSGGTSSYQAPSAPLPVNVTYPTNPTTGDATIVPPSSGSVYPSGPWQDNILSGPVEWSG